MVTVSGVARNARGQETPWSATYADPAATALLGVNYTDPADEVEYKGRAKVARIYFPPSGPPPANLLNKEQFKRAYDQGVRVFICSSKTNSPSVIGAAVAGAPADATIYWAHQHEPENGISAAVWKSEQTAMMKAVRDNGGIPIAILMSYTLNPSSGRNINDWVLPAGTIDVLGFDYYPPAQANRPIATVVADMKAQRSKFGVTKLLIGEFGVLKSDPTKGVTQVREFKTLMGVEDTAAMCYWSDQVDSTKPDYHFSSATADEWFKPI